MTYERKPLIQVAERLEENVKSKLGPTKFTSIMDGAIAVRKKITNRDKGAIDEEKIALPEKVYILGEMAVALQFSTVQRTYYEKNYREVLEGDPDFPTTRFEAGEVIKAVKDFLMKSIDKSDARMPQYVPERGSGWRRRD